MNWLRQFNDTLDFIERNITKDITSEDIVRISYVSYNHFLRMFMILSGMTVSEYIRKRRLSLAASDIVTTSSKVIDIAYKYQYKTPESFTKAFKQFHGVSPREARKNIGPLKSFPKLTFQVNIEGGIEMKYEIIKEDKLSFTGYSIDVTTVDGENFKIIPKFWQDIMNSERFEKLLNNCDNLGVVGICYEWQLEQNEFKYMIGVRNKDLELEGTEKIEFEPEVFAAFEAKGKLPESVQKTTKYIYSEWFPSSNYEHSPGPELEIYPKGNVGSEDYICYYWVPIKKK